MAFLKTYTVETLKNEETNTIAQICTSGRVLIDFHAYCSKYGTDGVNIEFPTVEDFIAFADDMQALKSIAQANEKSCNDDYCDI